MCQFFLILAIFSKKVLQFFGSTWIFPGRYLTWNCDFPHRQIIHVFLYKKSVLKPFLALAVIFCLHMFTSILSPEFVPSEIIAHTPIVRVFTEEKKIPNLNSCIFLLGSWSFFSYHAFCPLVTVFYLFWKNCFFRCCHTNLIFSGLYSFISRFFCTVQEIGWER